MKILKLKLKMLCLNLINYVAVFVRIKKKENRGLDNPDTHLYIETVINGHYYGNVFNQEFSGSWNSAANRKNWVEKTMLQINVHVFYIEKLRKYLKKHPNADQNELSAFWRKLNEG